MLRIYSLPGNGSAVFWILLILRTVCKKFFFFFLYIHFTDDETEDGDTKWFSQSHTAVVRIKIKPTSFWFEGLCLCYNMVKRFSCPELPILHRVLVLPLVSFLFFCTEASLSLYLYCAVDIFHITSYKESTVIVNSYNSWFFSIACALWRVKITMLIALWRSLIDEQVVFKNWSGPFARCI